MSKKLFLLCWAISGSLAACASTHKDPSLYTDFSCDELRKLQTSYQTLEKLQAQRNSSGLEANIPSSLANKAQHQGIAEIAHARDANNNIDFSAKRKGHREQNKTGKPASPQKKISHLKSARAAYRQNGCKAAG
ncbi:MAG: hypothetical protein ABJG88_05730 [Litorimonas sp.]